MTLNILNLMDNLVYGVFGDPIVFLIALLAGIVVFSAIMKISNEVMFGMIVAILLPVSFFINKILAVVLLLVLAGIGLAYSRFVSRG